MSDPKTASTRTISVEALARVEGEGALHLTLRGDKVVDARLRIYEPPRFFEAMLQGRDCTEAIDITARICGICPVAYQMSAVHAMEDALGVQITPEIRALRRLLYCGEWIESHTLHVSMLHAPDFLGYESAVHMAADHRSRVVSALALKKAGNAIVALLGGREIHPINVVVGGFYRAPTRDELRTLREPLARAFDEAIAMTRWVATFDMPDVELNHADLVSLWHPDEYPYNEGRMRSVGGIDVEVSAWRDTFEEVHVPHSTALHGRLATGGRYMVGPLARYAVAREQLAPEARQIADEVGLPPIVRNPFESIIVRSVEVVHACAEALRILDAYDTPDVSRVDVARRAGVGHAATEAPRGTLYHRYELAEDGAIVEALIVPPTAQNQPAIEADLAAVAQVHHDLPDEQLKHRCEQTIRNHDPCISCATHFLDLTVERLPEA